MQKPLCKFCGTRDHHASEMHLCKAMKSESRNAGVERTGSRVSSSGEAAVDISPLAVPVAVDAGNVVAAATGDDSPKDVQPPSRKALTNAQRCARYRAKNRERVLAADRARKAAKRTHDPPSG